MYMSGHSLCVNQHSMCTTFKHFSKTHGDLKCFEHGCVKCIDQCRLLLTTSTQYFSTIGIISKWFLNEWLKCSLLYNYCGVIRSKTWPSTCYMRPPCWSRLPSFYCYVNNYIVRSYRIMTVINNIVIWRIIKAEIIVV